ncbi:MAG: response regulator [Hyphomicrobiales bacterium]|nr:response regulator [Hyphomicrobiales bacterium]
MLQVAPRCLGSTCSHRIEIMNAPAPPPVESSLDPIELIMSTALDAVVVMNASGVICGWSGQAEAVFEFTADEAMGHPLGTMIVTERYREAHSAGLARY